jgi:hypothetical protein
MSNVKKNNALRYGLPILAQNHAKVIPQTKTSWIKELAPIIISTFTLITSCLFSFFISRDREYSKIRYDQQIKTFSKLLDIAIDLEGQSYHSDQLGYESDLSKFDLITNGELYLIVDSDVQKTAIIFRENARSFRSSRSAPDADSIELKMKGSYIEFVKALKKSMLANQK